MLALLENRLHGALKGAIDDTVQLVCGPAPEPAPEVERMVEVSVREFKMTIPSGNEAIRAGREPARISHAHTWNADGGETNFTLPADVRGEVVAVEAPPGHSVTLGDDCFIEDRTLHFYHPPPKGDPGVMAVLRGKQAKGYSESRPCSIAVNLSVRAEEIKDADALFARSLNALLAAFVDMETLRSPEDESGVNMRLLKPVAVPDSIQRRSHKTDASLVYCVTGNIAVFAELEISVALKAEEPEGIIKEIVYPTQPVKRTAGK